MGLVQRVIEEAGISTICLSNIADLTASIGAPRVAAIEYPGSQPFGPPFDVERQKAVLKATLEALQTIQVPGQVVELPFVWPKNQPKGIPRDMPPIAKLLFKKPWLLPKLISGNIPE